MTMTKILLSAAVMAALIMIAPGAHAQGARPAAKDEILGMSRERLARIAPVMKEQVEKGIFPGAVTLVARRGTIVHYEAHDFLDAAKTKPMTKDALFRLASMTKPVVTVGAMMLVEQGVIKLNDPISIWLPELKDMKVETQKIDKDGRVTTEDVPVNRPITVQDLMRHTAGFVYAGSTRSRRIKEMYEKADIEARDGDITGDEMLRQLGQIPLAHQPGTFWEYSIAVDILGVLMERATKKPLDQFLRDMLFEPLGMKDTAFWVPKEKVARLAEALDSDPLKAVFDKSYRILENPAGKSYFKGGAGLVGTAEDYLRFAQMIVNGGEYQGGVRRTRLSRGNRYSRGSRLGVAAGSYLFGKLGDSRRAGLYAASLERSLVDNPG